jgi:hypothetical protein
MAICTNVKQFPEYGDKVLRIEIPEAYSMDEVAKIYFESGKTVWIHYWSGGINSRGQLPNGDYQIKQKEINDSDKTIKMIISEKFPMEGEDKHIFDVFDIKIEDDFDKTVFYLIYRDNIWQWVNSFYYEIIEKI